MVKLLEQPGKTFCQHTSDQCPEVFPEFSPSTTLFLYPSQPTIIASTIEGSIEKLSQKYSKQQYLSWTKLKNQGKIIFCEICKAIYSSKFIVCDITTLNFNVLFEIGYIVGLGKQFIPIYDTSYGGKKNLLNKIGILDTIAYKEFLNSDDLTSVVEEGPAQITLQRVPAIDTFRPIYYLKAPLDTEGSIRITSTLKKSWFHFRVFDPAERSRLPLNVAINEVDKSRAVIVHLLSPERGEIATIHNARCAFVAGLAMASQKMVLLIQEGRFDQPIDYKDLINDYDNVAQIASIMEPFFRRLVEALQSPVKSVESSQRSILEDFDIGDIAAENEIHNLRSYYVRTGEFTTARKGHAQLLVGRKGTGKTALFYALRHHIGPERNDTLVLDLKPEGYQFAKLNDTILNKFSEAIQQHTLTALWDYVLLLELAHKILRDPKEIRNSSSDPEQGRLWAQIKEEYALHRSVEEGDFSERLSNLIDIIIKRSPDVDLVSGSPSITQLVFMHDIKKLKELIIEYLQDKEEVWVLFDNLDKNWRLKKTDEYEVMVLKCLLDASRKLQKMLKNDVNFHSVIFIRNDIYSFFLDKTTDRGKDQVVYLNWDDPELFKEIFRLRVIAATKMDGDGNAIWAKIFDLHVENASSFNYILDRTLMRPRDFLVFIKYAMQTAINRGHNRITEDDILRAEEVYSRDLFETLIYEISDIAPNLEDVLYCFLEETRTMYESDLKQILLKGKIPEDRLDEVIYILLWFGFLGVCTSDFSERYSYSSGYDITKLLKLSDWVEKEKSERIFAIHPGFTKVLELKKK